MISEAAADPATGRAWPLDEHDAPSPEDALQWLLDRAARLADRIDPPANAPWVPAASLRLAAAIAYVPATHLRTWARSTTGRTYALHALRSRGFRFITADDELRYSLTAHPVHTTTQSPTRPTS